MLATSNNDYAEFLLRHAAIARGTTPSWSGSIAMMTRTLVDAGIPTGGLRIADGSGLSRANRMPVATLAAVLTELWTDPDDAAVAFAWGAMPRAGQSGTLVDRYRLPQHSCAQGLVLAKTGTLTDAVALAGVARSVDGTDRVFVLIENGIVGRNTAVRRALDTLATAVVGCRLTS
jgi:D-alanyl-D-alanine carboxypeptidase/D-alanyl-D-alanine-endopeptidase (penicillin-binding protein 4)